MLHPNTIIVICLISRLVKGQNYDDEYADGEIEEPDYCNFYDTAMADLCHHKNFPSKKLAEIYNENVVTCCGGHSYLFFDNCKDRKAVNTLTCADPSKPSQQSLSQPIHALECPLGCRRDVELSSQQFDILPNGTIAAKIKEKVHDYCVSYHCNSDSNRTWAVKADVCLCHTDEAVKQADQKIPSNINRCCPETIHVERESKDKLTCPTSEGKLRLEAKAEGRLCDGEWLDVPLSSTNLSDKNEISFHVFGRLNVSGNRDSLQFCAGVSLVKGGMSRMQPVQPTFMYCHRDRDRCGGRKPCVRSCCSPNQVFQNSTCRDVKASAMSKYFENKILADLGVSEANFEKAADRKCPKGFKQSDIIRPWKKCNHRFSLEASDADGGHVILRRNSGESTNNYCINFEEKSEVSAEVCVVDDDARLKVYPYILLTSSFFLVVTLVIFTIYPKLLNNYTRLMRHFVCNLFFTFVLLSINQLVFLGQYSMALCQTSAFFQQYFFLTAFNFMTVMSIEISLLMSGRQGSSGRYRTQVSCGYAVPICITLITLVVELAAPDCATFRPRFGEEKCFFTDRLSKFLWFFLPISVMLLINFFMFVSAVSSIVRLGNQKKQFHLRTSEKRSDKMDQFLLYLKLFVGMGLIWVFEIIAGMSDDKEANWYFTDFLNMCQGIYVFLIFVCKRNVLKMILGKDTPQGRTVAKLRRLSRMGGGGGIGGVAGQTSGIDRSKGQDSSTTGTDLPLSTFAD